MPISFGLTSNLSIAQNLSVAGSGAFGAGVTLSSTTASSLLYSDSAKVVSSVTLASNLSLTTGTLALATALTSINSVTAASATDLTLSGGSSGASLVLGQGTTAGVTVSGTGSGATATAVNTGGLRSANFGLSTVSGGASYFGGMLSQSYSLATGPLAAYASSSGGLYAGFTSLTGFLRSVVDNSANPGAFEIQIGNGTSALTINSSRIVSIPGTTSASSSTVGALTIGNGTAATNVAIGGGNINAGGTITSGSYFSAPADSDFRLNYTYSRIAKGDGGGGFVSGYNVTYNGGVKHDSTGTIGATYHLPTGGISWYAAASQVAGTAATPAMSLATTGALSIVTSTASTSTTTGALQVAGGIGVAGASVFGSTVQTGKLGVGQASASQQLGITASSATTDFIAFSDSNTGGKQWLLGPSSATSFYIKNATDAITPLTITAAGAATFAGAVVTSSTTLSGAGAIPITTSLVKFTSTGGAQALTLANGTDGQRLTVVHDVDGGSGVLTPTTKTGFSTVTFTNAGDTVSLVYVTTRGWMVTGSYGVTIAP